MQFKELIILCAFFVIDIDYFPVSKCQLFGLRHI